jgi:hypothetical protein
VLGTVTNPGGTPIGADFTSSGFTVTGMVISQVYGGGGNSMSVFPNDFIELHNIGTTPASLDGLFVQFVSAGGAGAWAVQPLPADIVPPGGYYLIQEAAGANMPPAPTPLPTPDFPPAPPLPVFAIGNSGAKVALTSSATPLTQAATLCPALLARTTDLVGYGGANCVEGMSGGATANGTSIQRNGAGCADTDNNSVDFTVAVPVPRNGASPPLVCTPAP